jgi:hypothetical protein
MLIYNTLKLIQTASHGELTSFFTRTISVFMEKVFLSRKQIRFSRKKYFSLTEISNFHENSIPFHENHSIFMKTISFLMKIHIIYMKTASLFTKITSFS